MRLFLQRFKEGRIEGLLFFVLAVWIFYMSAKMDDFGSMALAPGLFPSIAAIILGVLGLTVLFSRGAAKADGDAGAKKAAPAATVSKDSASEFGNTKMDWLGVVIVFMLSMVYYWALPKLHFVAATILFLAIFLWYIGERRWWFVALLSAGSTGVIYYLFGTLLRVILP